jgi:HD-GYP domain-containing protein (c-di-GMP phosphodiesterase class II)/Tfp pilus assembly protein PilZ
MKPKELNQKHLYNSRIIDPYLYLLKNHYPTINIPQLLAHAKMKTYEVADQWHWFTQEQVNAFFDKVEELTNNKNIAREAGRYAASPEANTVIHQYVLGFLGPQRVYEWIGKAASSFTRSAKYESRRLDKNKIEIIVTPYPGVHEREFQCQNRIGFFEAISYLFRHKFPEIVHTECMFRDGQSCRYIVSWKPDEHPTLKFLRSASLLFSVSFFVAPFLSNAFAHTHLLAYGGLLTFFILWIVLEKKEKKSAWNSTESLRVSSGTLLDQIENNYNNALLTNAISQSISKEITINDILQSLIENFQKSLDFDRGFVLLANPENTHLSFEAGYGYSSKMEGLLKNTVFHLNNPDSKGALVVSFKEKKPILVNDINDIQEDLSPRSLDFAKKMGVKSFLCCPIVYDNEAIGILAVDNVTSKRPLLNSDLTLLCGIAPIIGISIRNAQLLQNRKQQFNSTLRALAATIDARDPLTAGHSERVTQFSLGICQELSLSEENCETIRVAALLHDYGKIAVPDAILKKTGRLSALEYDMVKTHADQTRLILEGIQFEGIYKDVPAIAGAHHEKIDGSGYPLGLTDEEIPLGAKIIAVADFFEAITSKRHYREPMPIGVAIKELRKKQGNHLDEDIVEAFLRYFKRDHTCAWDGGEPSELISPRGSVRIPCCTEVTILYQGKRCKATTTDISADGLFAASDLPISEGKVLMLSFNLPDDCTTHLEVSGRVAWVNHQCLPKKAIFPAGFGIAFTDLDKKHLKALANFISSHVLCAPPSADLTCRPN